jgi:photosystem II stability/assembly factor-like uncharacterized protein
MTGSMRMSLALAAVTWASACNCQGDDTTPDGGPLPFDEVTWESMNGPPGANHTYFAQDPYHPSHVYLGATRGVYRSTDRGDHWTHVYNGEQSTIAFSSERAFVCSASVVALEADGSTTDLAPPCRAVYATADDLYIALATDRALPSEPLVRLLRLPATTTEPVPIGPADSELPTALAAYLADPSYAAQVGGVYETSSGLLIRVNVLLTESLVDSFFLWSSDDGATWSASSSTLDPALRVNYVAQDPDDASRFILSATPRVGIDTSGFRPLSELILESTDDGRTWTSATTVIDRAAPEVRGVAIVAGDYVLTDVDRAVVQLLGPDHDHYVDWAAPGVPGYADPYDLEELAFDVSDASRAWGRGRLGWDGVIRTDDGGATWQRTMDGVAAAPAPNLAVDPSDPDVVVACGNLGFLPHITRDGGDSWEPLGGTFLMADEIAFDPVDPSHILMISELTDIARSEDAGRSWSLVAPQFTGTRVYDFAVSTTGEGTIYVSNLGFNISRFPRGNALLQPGVELNFQNMLQSPDYAYDIDVDPDDPDVLFTTYSPKVFEGFASVWRYDASEPANQGWVESLRIDDATGLTSVAIDPSDSQTVYAAATGDRARLYVSRDGGEDWQPFAGAGGTTFVTVHEVAVDAFDEGHVWAAPWGGGLFESLDGGASWTEASAPSRSIVTLLARRDHLLAADRTAPIVYESADGGATWSAVVHLDEERFVRIMSMAYHGDLIYFSALARSAGAPPALDGAVFRIGRDGLEELAVTLPGPVLRFASHPSGLYAVTHLEGVYRVDGDLWTDLSAGLPDMGFFDVHVDDQGAIWVAGGSDLDRDLQRRIGDDVVVNELYRSNDAGATWEPVLGDNRFGGPIKRMTSVPERPGVLVAATSNGVFTSIDRGASWAAQPGLGFANVGAIAIGPSRLYAGTLGGGVHTGKLEEPGEVTWLGSTGPYPAIHHLQIEVSYATPDTVYVTSYPGGVFRSHDGGETWLESNFAIPSFAVADPVLQGYYSLALDPADPDRLYLGVYRHGVFRSDDAGDTWMPMYGDPEVDRAGIRRLAIDPTDTSRLYLATEQGLFVSHDHAASWEPFNEGLDTLDILSVQVDDGGRVFAGTGGYGLYVYDGVAQAWAPVGGVGFGEWHVWERRLYQYSSLLFAPDDPDTLYLGHFPGGFFVSEDRGESWRSQSLGLGNDGMFSLVVHPEDPDVLFAGTYNGIVRSDDRGGRWRQSSAGMPSEQWPFDVVIDSDHPQVMYAATKNGQNKGFCDRNEFCGVLMKSTDGGQSWVEITSGMDDDREFYRLIIHPADHEVLFVSTDKGVFASSDAGASWLPMNEGLPTQVHRIRDNVARNMWLTADQRSLVLGVVDYGVWRADLSVLGL